MDLQYTATFRKVEGGYIAFAKEIPGANTQAGTLAQARKNLREAVTMVLEAQRILAKENPADTERKA